MQDAFKKTINSFFIALPVIAGVLMLINFINPLVQPLYQKIFTGSYLLRSSDRRPCREYKLRHSCRKLCYGRGAFARRGKPPGRNRIRPFLVFGRFHYFSTRSNAPWSALRALPQRAEFHILDNNFNTGGFSPRSYKVCLLFFKKIPGRYIFLSGVVLLYLGVFAVSPASSIDMLRSSYDEMIAIAPYIIAVFIVMFFMNIFIKPSFVRKHLGSDSGLRGWIYSALGAMIFPGPPYIIFPLLEDLRNHGMRYSLVACFLNNRSVQPIFLPVFIHYFGLLFSLIVWAFVFIFSIISAIIIERLFMRQEAEFNPR